ncbi:MAG: DUF1648 domain-containing protein [Thermoanaerobaculia bacterium]
MSDRARNFLIALMATALFILWRSQSLPERVASHFDFQGVADGFIARRALVVLLLALAMFGPSILFAVGTFALKLPDSLINLPNKEYWLAPERRAGSLAFFQRVLDRMTLSLLLLLVLLFEEVVRANRREPPRLDEAYFYVGLGAFLLFQAVEVIRLRRRFRKVR